MADSLRVVAQQDPNTTLIPKDAKSYGQLIQWCSFANHEVLPILDLGLVLLLEENHTTRNPSMQQKLWSRGLQSTLMGTCLIILISLVKD